VGVLGRKQRTTRLSEDFEAVAGGGRWQRALHFDPEKFQQVQAADTGRPLVRTGVDPRIVTAWTQLWETLLGYAGSRVAPLLAQSAQEAVTLSPYTESIQLNPPRWGAKLPLPDGRVPSAPTDGGLWHDCAHDVARGRGVWELLRRAFEQAQAQASETGEPRPALLARTLFDATPWQLPEAWQGPDFAPLGHVLRELAESVLITLLGDTPPHRLLATGMLAGLNTLAPAPSVAAQATPLLRGRRDRATPPTRLLPELTERLAKELPGDDLEQAWEAALLDDALGRLLSLLSTRDIVVETEPALWDAPDRFGAAHPWLQRLQKLDEGEADGLRDLHKQESGRFKRKARHQRGAAFLAQGALLHQVDQWLGQLATTPAEALERADLETSRIEEEAAREALIPFLLSTSGTTQIAAEPEPTAATPTTKALQAGHLFADLKGFTALTAQLREVETRQLLRRHFYLPLLELAKTYFRGGTDMADRGGIRLNNLLGDAVSLCGDPSDLMDFAERASERVQSELRNLLKAAGAGAADELAAREAIDKALSELKVKAAKDGLTPAEEQQQTTLRAQRDALAEANVSGGEKLDLGFFIAYGDAPIDLTLDDDIFGHVHVALAEKINESARGVERNPHVGAALSRFRAIHHDRPLAFRVHVGPELVGEWPEALLDAWPTSPEEAGTLAMSMGGQLQFSGATALYNTGIALSPQTLAALIAGPLDGEAVVWTGKSETLAETVRPQLLVEPQQTLLLVPWQNGHRLLRRLGHAAMRGYQQPPLLWEWVGPWLPVYGRLEAFVAREGRAVQLAEWVAEA